MSPEQAIEYALSAEDTSPQAAPEPRAAVPPDPLARRQREVSILVGQDIKVHGLQPRGRDPQETEPPLPLPDSRLGHRD